MSQQSRGKMTAGGRTHNTDAAGIQFEFRGPRAKCAHGARGILEHDRVVIPAGAKPIFQNEANNSTFVKEASVMFTFMIGQAAIAAPRANNDGGPLGSATLRPVRGKSGDIFLGFTQRTGSAIRPQRERIRRLCHRQSDWKAESEQY